MQDLISEEMPKLQSMLLIPFSAIVLNKFHASKLGSVAYWFIVEALCVLLPEELLVLHLGGD
jgi:hypothetical protein